MKNLKLNQINNQQLAVREMNGIKGGILWYQSQSEAEHKCGECKFECNADIKNEIGASAYS